MGTQQTPPTPGTREALEYALSLARSFCYKRRVPPHLWDTYEAEAALSLAKCLASFDPARGVPLMAFAALSVSRDLKDLQRSQLGKRRYGTLPPAGPCDPRETLDLRRDLSRALLSLSGDELEIVSRVCLLEEKACEVALSLGISKGWLSRKLARILERLRAEIRQEQ